MFTGWRNIRNDILPNSKRMYAEELSDKLQEFIKKPTVCREGHCTVLTHVDQLNAYFPCFVSKGRSFMHPVWKTQYRSRVNCTGVVLTLRGTWSYKLLRGLIAEIWRFSFRFSNFSRSNQALVLKRTCVADSIVVEVLFCQSLATLTSNAVASDGWIIVWLFKTCELK